MPIVHISDLNHPDLAPYTALTEAQLRNRLNPDQALFIAESPKVINVALNQGYAPLSLLCEERHIEGDAAAIIERCPDLTVYTGSREMLATLTGYTLTRGVLCAMRRPAPLSLEEVTREARRIVVIDGVVDATNIGAIFRSAAAIGIDAVLLTPTSCDPFNRRSIRVSMGTVFQVPWTWIPEGAQALKALGIKTAAMALSDNSLPLDAPELKQIPRLALIMGTEGDGLPQATIDSSDYVVRIPMKHGVDSLNVAAAAAIACWELRIKE